MAYYVMQGFQGQGLMKKGVKKALEYMFTIEKLNRIEG